jgi:acyl carrier protein
MSLFQQYEELIRRHSQLADEDGPLDSDAPMTQLGIESAQIVLLILELEETFQIELPGSFLTPEVFATPRSLWSALSNLFDASDEAKSAPPS